MDTMIREDRVRDLRSKMGWSQSRLAREMTDRGARTAPSHISALEGGRKSMGATKIATLALALGTSTNYLLGLTDEPAPPSNRSDMVSAPVRDPIKRAQIQHAIDLMANATPADVTFTTEIIARLLEDKLTPQVATRKSQIESPKRAETRIEDSVRSLVDEATYRKLMELLGNALHTGNSDQLDQATRSAAAQIRITGSGARVHDYPVEMPPLYQANTRSNVSEHE